MTGKNRLKSAELTPRHTRAITALLTSPTRAAAAASCGIAERTIRTYFSDPIFCQALAEAESAALSEAARRLAADATNATLVLKRLMDDDDAPPAVRVNAAKSWLQLTPIFREHVILEARITRLEKQLNELPKPNHSN